MAIIFYELNEVPKKDFDYYSSLSRAQALDD